MTKKPKPTPWQPSYEDGFRAGVAAWHNDWPARTAVNTFTNHPTWLAGWHDGYEHAMEITNTHKEKTLETDLKQKDLDSPRDGQILMYWTPFLNFQRTHSPTWAIATKGTHAVTSVRISFRRVRRWLRASKNRYMWITLEGRVATIHQTCDPDGQGSVM